MTVRVMHRLAVKLCAVFRWMFASCGHRPMIALAIVQVMVHVSVEVLRPVKPWTRANEYAAYKPLRAIISIRGAVIRRHFVVPVRTNWWLTDANRNLRLRAVTVN
jgi:hypothetical protein